MSNKLIKPQSNDIIIDDGIKVYNIKNKQGKYLGKFEFRPADTNIVNRYKEVVDYFNHLTIPDGESEETVKRVEKEVVEKMNYLIGGDAEKSFFSILGAFSVLESGELFLENVLGAIAGVIEREFSVRATRMKRRNKYVSKYHK